MVYEAWITLGLYGIMDLLIFLNETPQLLLYLLLLNSDLHFHTQDLTAACRLRQSWTFVWPEMNTAFTFVHLTFMEHAVLTGRWGDSGEAPRVLLEHRRQFPISQVVESLFN